MTQDAFSGGLSKYHMVWAVTANTINSQLSYLTKHGFISTKVKFGELDSSGLEVDGVIGAPTIEFITNDVSSVYFFVPFKSGSSVKYYNGFGKKAPLATADINGWIMAFKVKIDYAQLASNWESTGQDIPDSVKGILKDFTSSEFKIYSIFLHLQDANTIEYDTTRSTMPPDMSAIVAGLLPTQMSIWIANQREKGKNPYVLGYVATPQRSNDRSLFQPTGATTIGKAYYFQPNAPHDKIKAGLGTLTYLMMTHNEPVPLYQADQNNLNFVEDNNIDGVGFIKNTIFANDYVKDQLLEQVRFGIGSPNGFNQSSSSIWASDWSKTDSKLYPNADSGLVDVHGDFTTTVHATATLSNKKWSTDNNTYPCISFSGYFYYKALYWEKPLGMRVESWQSTQLDWTLDVFFRAGTNGSIMLETVFNKENPKNDRSQSWLDKLASWFGTGYSKTLDQVQGQYNAFSSSRFEALKDFVNRSFKTLGKQVILPAPSVFDYKDLFFTPEFHFRSSLTYRTEE